MLILVFTVGWLASKSAWASRAAAPSQMRSPLGTHMMMVDTVLSRSQENACDDQDGQKHGGDKNGTRKG